MVKKNVTSLCNNIELIYYYYYYYHCRHYDNYYFYLKGLGVECPNGEVSGKDEVQVIAKVAQKMLVQGKAV